MFYACAFKTPYTPDPVHTEQHVRQLLCTPRAVKHCVTSGPHAGSFTPGVCTAVVTAGGFVHLALVRRQWNVRSPTLKTRKAAVQPSSCQGTDCWGISITAPSLPRSAETERIEVTPSGVVLQLLGPPLNGVTSA